MRMIGSNAILCDSPTPSYDIACPNDTWVSKNVASLAAMTMSASATKWSPPPAQLPLTAAMTGVHTWLCHAVNRSSASRVRRDCSRHRLLVTAQRGDVETGLEVCARSRC